MKRRYVRQIYKLYMFVYIQERSIQMKDLYLRSHCIDAVHLYSLKWFICAEGIIRIIIYIMLTIFIRENSVTEYLRINFDLS